MRKLYGDLTTKWENYMKTKQESEITTWRLGGYDLGDCDKLS